MTRWRRGTAVEGVGELFHSATRSLIASLWSFLAFGNIVWIQSDVKSLVKMEPTGMALRQREREGQPKSLSWLRNVQSPETLPQTHDLSVCPET